MAEKHGLEKIKTIGDAYMAVSGVPVPRSDHLERIADAALEMRRLDLWGDPVTMASRMESQGVPGGIQVTARAEERLRSRYALTPRGGIEIKGRGRMETYLLGERIG